MKWVESFNTCTRLLDDSLCVDSELSIDELSVEVRIHFIPTNTISTRLWICLAENVQIIILRPEYFSPRLVLSLNLRRKKKNSYRRTSSPGRDLHTSPRRRGRGKNRQVAPTYLRIRWLATQLPARGTCYRVESLAKGPQPRWLATGLHLHARLSFIVRTYRGAPYKARPPVRLSACHREGYCQRQMDVQWATRVAYNRA